MYRCNVSSKSGGSGLLASNLLVLGYKMPSGGLSLTVVRLFTSSYVGIFSYKYHVVHLSKNGLDKP